MMSLKNEYVNKKVLITGGLGFLGSNLAHKLVDFGSEVTILDALFPQYGGNIFNITGIEDRVTLVIGDIRNFRLIEHIINDKDIIFNLAAQVSYIDSINIPLEDLDINCKGHLMVLDACRHRNPRARIVFSSSRMVIGKVCAELVDEDHVTEPLSIYGIHKLAGEKYYTAYNKTYHLNTVILRITNPYGIRQQMKHSKYSLVGWFLRQAMEGNPIKIFGDGSQVRDYIYVEDIVNAFLCAGVKNDDGGQIYNVGKGESHRFSDMVHTVVKTVGKGKIEYVDWPKAYENIETGDFRLSIAKANKHLGWEPSIGLEEGIERTFRFYEEYKDHYW